MSSLLLDAPVQPVAGREGPWVRPWDDAAQVEYERLVEREISSLRARNRTYRLQVLVSMR